MRLNFKSAYPVTPLSFHAAMENTLRKVENMKVKKRTKFATILMAAIIGALLLAGLAYAAATSGVLSILFERRAPSLEAGQLVIPVAQSVRRDGITLSIDDFLIDGAKVLVSYTVTSDRNESVFFTVKRTTSLNLDEPDVDYECPMRLLGGNVESLKMPNSYRNLIWLDELSSMPREPFECAITVRVSRPKVPVVLDPAAVLRPMVEKDSEEQVNSMAAHKQGGQLPVTRSGLSEFPIWFVDMENGGVTELCAEAGYIEPLVELRLKVKIDPSEAPEQTRAYLPEELVYTFDDYTACVEFVDITATEAQMSMHILPIVSMRQSGLTTESYMKKYGRNYALLAEDGRDLTGKTFLMAPSSDGLMSSKPEFHYILHSMPLSEIPQTLVLAPKVKDSAGNVTGYAMDEAITIPLRTVTAGELTSSDAYYTTPSGKYYHIEQQCSGMENSIVLTGAQLEERQPCPICIP